MTKFILGFVLAFIFCRSAPAQDTHTVKINEFKDKIETRVVYLLAEANRLDESFSRGNYKSAGTDTIRAFSTNIFTSAAWKNLSSRETKKYKTAMYDVEREITNMEVVLNSERRTLADLQTSSIYRSYSTHPEPPALPPLTTRRAENGVSQNQPRESEKPKRK